MLFEQEIMSKIMETLENNNDKKSGTPIKYGTDNASFISQKIGVDLQEIGKILVDMSLATQAYNKEVNDKKEKRMKYIEKALERGEAADFMNDIPSVFNSVSMDTVNSVTDRYNGFVERVSNDGILETFIGGRLISYCCSLFYAMCDEFSRKCVYSRTAFNQEYIQHDADVLRNHVEGKQNNDESIEKLVERFFGEMIKGI